MPAFYTRASLLAVLLVISYLAFGQDAGPAPAAADAAAAPTAAAPAPVADVGARSDAWMDSVRRLPLPAQVAAVRARVLADTVLRHRHQYVCLLPLTAAEREAYRRAQQPREQAEAARPAGPLLVYLLDETGLYDNRSSQTEAFVRQLDARRIRSITLMPSGKMAAALYGDWGRNGVVLLSSQEEHKTR